MSQSRALRWLAAALITAFLVLFALTRPAWAQPPTIPWDGALTITRTSSGEDIKNVLRSIVQANGMSIIFAPDVQGAVSFRLDRVPLSMAFEQLIDENGLAYTYNAGTRTVNVSTLGGGGGDDSGERAATFVPLGQVTYREVVDAMASFGVPAQGIRYDAGSRTVAISGPAARIQQVTSLIATLETARQRQRERDNTDRQREVQLRQAEMTQRAYEDLSRFEVRVIPLRFTDVGPSAKTFQGREVTIPGIEDTLKSILGLDVSGQPSSLAVGAPTDLTPGAAPNLDIGAAQQLGHPRISIDQRTNSVVVHGTPEAIAAIEKIIRELDRPLQMVEIEVIIATADVGVARQLGINWRGSDTNPNGDPRSIAIDTGTTGTPIRNGTGTSLFDTNGLNALSLLPAATAANSTVASFVIRGTEGALQAQLQALASDDKARILSAPRLITLDNLTARITRSQNIFVQVDTRNPEGGGTGGVGLQEIQTGLTLEITPSVVPAESDRDEALVRLNLRAENSAPGSGSFGQIDVRSQEVQTNVLVPHGATFVIGGLFDESQIANEAGIPGLKDIPLLGALFNHKQSTKTQGETIFFITPRIVDERTVLQNDIAVKVGSEDYIRRERRALSAVHDSFNENVALPSLPPSAIEEDE